MADRRQAELAADDLIDDHGQHDNRADSDLLPEGLHIEQHEAIADHRNDQHAGQRADHAADAPHQRGSADDGSGHRVEKVGGAEIAVAGVEPRAQHDAGDRRAQTADKKGGYDHAVDADPGHLGGTPPAAGGIELDAELRPGQDQMDRDIDGGGDDDRNRD